MEAKRRIIIFRQFSLGRIFYAVAFCLFSVRGLFAQEAIQYKRNLDAKICNFQIFSERCSGSQYVTQLVKRNLRFNEEDRTYPGTFGHKHFPPWFSLGQEAYDGPDEFYTFEGSEETLFIVIFRNPYDWVRSFHTKPFHGKGRFARMSFSKFIRTPWILKKNDPTLQKIKEYHAYLDRDPQTGGWFQNVLKLRAAKARNMRAIVDHVDNIYFIRYETARDYPEKVIEEISEIFKIPKKEGFDFIGQYYRGNIESGTYKGSKYPKISFRDLLYINSQLDPEIEEWMGYELTADVHAVP